MEDDDVWNSGDFDIYDWKMMGLWRLILDVCGKLW